MTGDGPNDKSGGVQRRTALNLKQPSPLVPLRCTFVHLAGPEDAAAAAFLACAGAEERGGDTPADCEMVVRTKTIEAPLRIATRGGSVEYVLRVVATRPLRPVQGPTLRRLPSGQASRLMRDMIAKDDHWMLDVQISRADANGDTLAQQDRSYDAEATALVESAS
jgi:hypothetical protein